VNRRFELCRLIADGLVASEGDLLLPATVSRTSRQKFQRAFAQEFLCPFDALRERLGPSVPADEDIEDAAAHFEVSPLVIQTTLVNKGILPRDLLSANSELELAPTGIRK
jgi:Zn-dependent peptidase ImmA (M78 family)